MNFAALFSAAGPFLIPLLEKWVPIAIASPQGQAFIADIIKIVAAAHAASASTTPAAPGPVLSGPTFKFDS